MKLEPKEVELEPKEGEFEKNNVDDTFCNINIKHHHMINTFAITILQSAEYDCKIEIK